MKKVVTVTLGSSEQDFEFKTKFLGQEFQVRRLGADMDTSKAWELMRREQAKADAMALGEISDHYNVGTRTITHRQTVRLTKVVTRVPVTTGATLRRLLQVRAVRHVHKELGNYFTNNIVLFLSGIRNWDMAVAMSDYTRNLNFADPVFQTGAPALLTSLQQLELYAKGKSLMIGGRRADMLESALTGLKNKRVAMAAAKAHVIVGTFQELKAVADGKNLAGKTLITSAVGEERLKFFKDQKVNLVIDVSPKLFDRVVGISTIEAMILAALDKPANEVSDDDFEEIIHELDIKPRLLHPTGKFRNIRRFAFVIHPLSQEYIRKGFPIPKATPKFLMDRVEQIAAYMPPIVYCKMENIVSPTGAEAEGWLITVGGTPREMLSHSPEFTYRRLLAAADMAEKMGAQIMGLGAFTKVVGDAGITVARRARIPITTGNSYSASGALWAAADAMRRMGLVKIDPKTRKVAAKTMVIGASGSIGSVSARLLAMAFDEVYIAGRDAKKLEPLKASILKDTPDAKVFTTDDYDNLLGDMDMIVTSTSGAGKKVLDIMKVKPGCVITDVARPLDLPPSEVKKRPDVLVIESGEIELPSPVKGLKNIGLPPNVVYACLAETIVLALEGRFEVFTIGRDTEWEKVKEIYKLGRKHGMKLAAIAGVNGVFTDKDIAKVVTLARKARKTWKGGDGAKARKAAPRKAAAKAPAAARKPAKKAAAASRKAAARSPRQSA
jgi:predicted amino acid dehydrogenase